MNPPGWVIVSQGGTGPGRDRVTNSLKNLGVGWWHQFDNVWLVNGWPEITAGNLLEWVRKIADDSAYWMVIRADGSGDWAANGPPGHFDWLTENWPPYNPFKLL